MYIYIYTKYYIYILLYYIIYIDFIIYMYIYIPYASEASFCKASTLFETKNPKSGPSIALPKCLPPVAMMAQKFHQELFLGVSGFQYDIYYRNLQNKKQ